MAKIIKYKFLSGENPIDAFIECKTQAQFDANYPLAEREAIPDTINVSGEFEPAQDNASAEERIAALEEALTLLLEGATE